MRYCSSTPTTGSPRTRSPGWPGRLEPERRARSPPRPRFRAVAERSQRPDPGSRTARFCPDPGCPRPPFCPVPGSVAAPYCPDPGCDPLPLLLERNLFANGGHLLIRRDAPSTARAAFGPGIAYGEDWEYWIRLALLGRFAAAPGPCPVLCSSASARAAPICAWRATPIRSAPAWTRSSPTPPSLARFGAARLAAIRRRAEAENRWIVGRELVRHGRARRGPRLAAPLGGGESRASSARILLAAAHALPVLPRRLRGPFRAYPAG